MPSYQFITGNYENDGSTTFRVRDENNVRRSLKIVGFEPYSYILADERIPDDERIIRVDSDVPIAIYGESVKKIIYQAPNVVPDFREIFEDRWEDNIEYVERHLIDMGIKGGFEAPSGTTLHYTDLVPSDFRLSPLKCFWDVECYASTRFPDISDPRQKITSITLWNDARPHYDTLLLDDVKKKTRIASDHTIYHIPDEKLLLTMTIKYLNTLLPDVLAEWGAFDREYFPPRTRLHKIDTSVFRKFCAFNMIPAYKNLYQKGSGRLKDVAFDEGLTDEIEPEVNYADMWDNDRMGLAMRNKRHVEWIVELNKKKRNFVESYYWNLKNIVGLKSLQAATSHKTLVDTMLLRRYHGKYVLPSGSEYEKSEGLLGALTKKPPKRLIEDIAVLDFSRYYGNIVVALNLSPEPHGDKLGVVPQLCLDLMDERDVYDEMLKKTAIDTDEYRAMKGIRDSVKFIGEAVIGYFGSTYSRLYSPPVYEAVIKTGRKGLLFLEDTTTKLGYKLVYYDTDGIFVPVKPREVEELILNLNNAMMGFCEEQGIDRELKLKRDWHSDLMLFMGVKKRYAAHVIWEDDKDVDYILIKGFEFVRRDSSLVTRRVQRQTFENLLRGGMSSLREYLNGVIKSMKRGELSLREVALSKGIRQKFKDYKTRPDFVRGALWSNKYLGADIRAGDQVFMIYVKRTPGYPFSDVVCFLDEEIIPKNFVIDWQKMIDRTIQKKVEEIIKQGGLSWGRVAGSRKLTEAFR